MVTKKTSKEKELKDENMRLKKALAVCLDRPLLKRIRGALRRIERGEYAGKEEFLKKSPLRYAQ